MEQPVLTLENVSGILSSRQLIAEPGTYSLRTTNVTLYDGKFICNFNAMTQYHVDRAMELIETNELREAANQGISASLRPTDYIPSKGEFVKVTIDRVTTNNGVTGLFVIGVSEIKSASTSKVDFAALLKSKAEQGFEKISQTPETVK